MEWQLDILRFIQQFKHPVLDVLFQAITMSAEELFFIVAAAWLLWCHNKQLGYRLGFALLTSAAFNPFLKNLIRFERPIGLEGIVSERVHTATGYSFPSGHTQGGTAFWTGIISWYKKPAMTILGISAIFLVALSRMYLGVHWLTDVLGGILFGVLWVLGCNALFDYSRRIKKLWLPGLLFAPLALGLFFFNRHNDDTALTVAFAAALGFFLGYLFEQAKLQFIVNNRWPVQLLKIVIGLVVVILIKEGLKLVLPLPLLIRDFIRYCLIGFWISGGAPWLFQRLKLDGKAAADSPPPAN
jgi:membrane-associated phospholipid phosphatase